MPFIFLGIPIWVGRKLHARYSNGSRHRRNLAVVGGVTASVSSVYRYLFSSVCLIIGNYYFFITIELKLIFIIFLLESQDLCVF